MADSSAAGAQPAVLQLSEAHRAALEPYLPPKLREDETQSSHLTLTYAQSIDSQISLSHGVQTVLSGPETKAMTHYLRSKHDGILVGIGTALADNPSLNCRYSEDGINPVGKERQPTPIILDPNARWLNAENSKVVQLSREQRGKMPVWLLSQEKYDQFYGHASKSPQMNGFMLIARGPPVKNSRRWYSITACLRELKIGSVMVEGGGQIIEGLLRKQNILFVDSVIVTIAPVWLGQGGVTTVPPRAEEEGRQEVARLKKTKWIPMGNDVVVAGKFFS